MSEPSKRALRPAQAAKKLGISVPTLYRLHRTRPDFPRIRKLSERVSILDEDEIDAFRAALKVTA